MFGRVKSLFRVLAGLTLLLSLPLSAAPAAIQYSAEIYQKLPQGGEVTGRVYVGREGMRTDMTRNGERMIQQVDTRRGVSRILFPEKRTYLEMPAGRTPPDAARGGEVDPCQGLPGAHCRRLGEETLNGRPVVKWAVSFNQQGRQIEGTQWIDRERGMVVRQEMPDGQRMALKLLGTEKLNGRRVEKWAVDMEANGNRQRSYRWYDPELNLVVREVMPGGFVREMRNIRVGPQDPALFRLPKGYRKMAAGQGGGGLPR
ncbi:MAG TPA: hypothetical protein ENK50_07510 [Sedimenticola sp.]|nr:hypothetical protein [Sedimenticola sp.]